MSGRQSLEEMSDRDLIESLVATFRRNSGRELTDAELVEEVARQAEVTCATDSVAFRAGLVARVARHLGVTR